MTIFQKASLGIFFCFIAMFVYVTVIAYSRDSGHTGMDMSKVRKIRQEAALR